MLHIITFVGCKNTESQLVPHELWWLANIFLKRDFTNVAIS